MLHNQTPQPSSVVTMPLNPHGRDFVIGDLSGCMVLLETLLYWVEFDPKCDRLFSVGNLIGAGPDCLGALRALHDWPAFHAARGCYEDNALEHFKNHGPGIDGHHGWLHQEGHWYHQVQDAATGWIHRTLESMPLAIEIPLKDGRTVGIVHSEVDPLLGWEWVQTLKGLPREPKGQAGHARRNQSPTGPEGAIDYLVTETALSSAAFSLVTPERRWWNAKRKAEVLSHCAPTPGVDLLIHGHVPTPNLITVALGNRLYIDTNAERCEGRLTMVELDQGGCFFQAGWQCHPFAAQPTVFVAPVPKSPTRTEISRLLERYG